MKSVLALLALLTVAGTVLPPATASAHVYRYHGRYYHYRYHGRYYNFRRCHWNGRVHVCRYY